MTFFCLIMKNIEVRKKNIFVKIVLFFSLHLGGWAVTENEVFMKVLKNNTLPFLRQF